MRWEIVEGRREKGGYATLHIPHVLILTVFLMMSFTDLFFKLFLFLVYRVRHRRSSTPAHFKIHFSVCRCRIESVITFHLSVGI